MAIRTILTDDHPKLRKKCRAVEKFDGRLCELLDDMKETMALADGAGLAAPQVGVLKRVVVIDVGEGPIELVNPEITDTEGEIIEMEGCLSLPEYRGYVPRPVRAKLRAQDRDGSWFELEGEGLLARAMCHEVDHLDGVLMTDREIEPTDEQLDEIIRRSGAGADPVPDGDA